MNWAVVFLGVIIILMIGLILVMSQVVGMLHDLHTQREDQHKEVITHLDHLCQSANYQRTLIEQQGCYQGWL